VSSTIAALRADTDFEVLFSEATESWGVVGNFTGHVYARCLDHNEAVELSEAFFAMKQRFQRTKGATRC